ncbi:MAG: fused MFS/spermidine synthase [Candidatus Zixiibacteriota bacterium]
MVAQIVLFRQMMVSFYGNELSLGVMLSVWLFWVGIGSALGNRIAARHVYSPQKLSLWYFLISLAALLTIVLIRFSRPILGTAPAEIVGFLPMFVFAFAAMSPLCLCLGISFVLNSKSWVLDESSIFAVNRVYLWESLGAAVGGFLVTFALIPYFSNFSIVTILFCLDLLLSALLLARDAKRWRKILVGVMAICIVFGFILSGLSDALDRFSATKMWRGLPLVYSKDTKYGNISVTRQSEQITFYENGLLLFSYPDESSSEEAIHFALLEHPHPRRLLLIGGGVGGALSQALKYDSLRIDYVEIDPELIRTGEAELPEEETRSLNNPRVKIHFMDGRLFVKEESQRKTAERYDVIILNLPDPYTAQLNRFFTFEFFGMTKSVLNQGGIFSFRVSSAENYISPELSLYLSSIHQTLKSSFEEVKVLPGSNNIFLASNKNGILFDDWQTMVARLIQRNISTRFVNQNFLPDRLAPSKIAYLRDALLQQSGRTNYDLRPVCYFYNSILWSKQFNSLEKPGLLLLSRVKSGWFMVASVVVFSLLFTWRVLSGSKSANLALAAIFVAGYSSILVEMIVVLSLQAFYGYVYSMVGLIFTLFMVGLSLGAFGAQTVAKKKRISFGGLRLAQLFQVLLVFFLLLIIRGSSVTSLGGAATMVFLLLCITVSGMLGGAVFSLANHLFLEERTVLRAGTGYSADLLGAGLGSILASAVLIPLLGIPAALTTLLVVNVVCFCFLLVPVR